MLQIQHADCRGNAVKQHTYNAEVTEVSCKLCRGSAVKQDTYNAEIALFSIMQIMKRHCNVVKTSYRPGLQRYVAYSIDHGEVQCFCKGSSLHRYYAEVCKVSCR